MTIRTLALDSGVTSIQDHRLTLGAFMAPGSSALERRGGLYYYPGAADLVSAAALQATVSPFVAVVDGTSNSLQGQVVVVVDTAVTLTFSAGEPSVARTDRVVLQVRDTTYDASGSTDARVLIVKGNTSTGAANAVPASSLWLWDVVVPIGASSITFSSARVDRRQWTSTPMRVPVNSSTERDALPAIPGLEVTRLDTGNIEQYWSSAWRTVGPPAAPTRFLVANQAARDALTPTSGLEVTRLDTGDVEQYWSGAWRILVPVQAGAELSVARKTALTTRTSTTTFTDDPDLVLPMAANAFYIFELFIIYKAIEAADMKVFLSRPSAAVVYSNFDYLVTAPTTGVQGPKRYDEDGAVPTGAASGVGVSTTGTAVLQAKGAVLTGAAAGNFVFQWAQQTSSTTGTSVLAGSFMRLHRTT